ncbi:MAG: fibronectin type III domain-containing protein [Bdellovibrionales bacterium]|nr:fibronectin type III domain-containing protein [Bdellovibrionales bacterium]
MQRTDRILIILALLLLCLTMGAFYGFDSIFNSRERGGTDAIAMIVGGSGDMRVRYKNELHWQKARSDEKLIFDDAIFAGERSQVDLKVGASDLRVDSNTLIVLRKSDLFSTLDLNYGSLRGWIAPGDKLRIESNGEVVEFSSSEKTQLSLVKKDGKMRVKVQSGIARVIRDGKAQNLTPNDSMVVGKEDPLRFNLPQRSHFYSFEDRRRVDLAWSYSSLRSTNAQDEFAVEISETSDFSRLTAKENLKGKAAISVALNVPSAQYVRVKDSHGNLSETRQLVLAKPQAPVIKAPKAREGFETADKLNLKVEVQPLTPGSGLHVQIARDAQFQQLIADKLSSAPEVEVELVLGDYFVRARSLYEADRLQSAWTDPLPIYVREPLDVHRMARGGMAYDILIPNLEYPKALYKAPVAQVQNHLRAQRHFADYFSNYMRKGYDLVLSRRHSDEEKVQRTPDLPAEWILPGRLDFLYHMAAQGESQTRPSIHRLRIAMEAPKALRADDKGQLNWSPILFATKYEGQLQDSRGRMSSFFTAGSMHKAALAPGVTYSYKVRALGRAGQPISGWSESYRFKTEPAPVPVPVLAQKQEPQREPAQDMASNRATLKVERSWWDKVGAWLWAGTGFNFVLVRQTIASTADVEYKNTKAPSLFIEAGYLNDHYGGVVSYKRTPGDVRVDNYPVDKRDFVWSTYSGEMLAMLPWRGEVLNYPLKWGVRAGLQMHRFPFLFVAGRSLIQAANNMTTASLGFFAETVGRIKYHWSMRYQQPIKSDTEGGNQFHVTPVTAFDGSIGASYLLTRNLKTGLFWYGQMHDYKFSYSSATEKNIGKQWLFYSNAEMRLGYDF